MLPPVTIYTTPDDIKYVLYGSPSRSYSEVISDEIRKKGVWNKGCLDFCDKVLGSYKEPMRVIDVGGGLGSFSIPLAIKYANRHIFSSYEPMHSLYLQLCANVLLNNLSNVKTYNTALADFADTLDAPILDVERCANHGSYSFIENINFLRGMAVDGPKEPFEFRTLDSYRFAKVGLLKVSAPGMELQVLKGASETIISSGFPPILTEAWSIDWYKDQKQKIIEFFQSHGYEHYCMMGEHIMAFKTQDQYNSIMENVQQNNNVVNTPRVDNTTGEFSINERNHDIEQVLQNQVPRQ